MTACCIYWPAESKTLKPGLENPILLLLEALRPSPGRGEDRQWLAMVDMVGHSTCTEQLREAPGPQCSSQTDVCRRRLRLLAALPCTPSSTAASSASLSCPTSELAWSTSDQAPRRSGGKHLQGRVTEKGHYRLVVLIRACWCIEGCDRT